MAEGEEDVEHVKASRSGDFIEGGPRQDGGGPANGSVAVLGKEFPETDSGDSAADAGSSVAGGSAASTAGRLSGRRDCTVRAGGLASPEVGQAAGSF